MFRLIDANSFKLYLRTAKAIAYLNTIDDCDTEEEAAKFDDEMYYSTKAFIDVIDHRPTVDAVPVVRCKDCRFFSTDYHDDYGWICDTWCKLNNIPMTKESFCSNGERKENKQDATDD